MDEKNKTWTLRFPAKENPNMEKALFDWPIVLQYDVKAKYRLISRKFSGMKFFHPSVRLTNQKPARVCILSINHQIALFPFFCCFCFVRAFSFQGHMKIALLVDEAKSSYTKTLKTQLYLEYRRFTCDFLIASKVCETKFKDFCHPCTVDSEPGVNMSGARFCKVPITFRARNQIFRSKYKE